MQQQWEAFWARVSELGHHALSPFRAAAEALGYFPSDIQIWCFLCAVFISALVLPHTYGDLVLARRRLTTTGKVVEVDTSGDAPYTPVIEFRHIAGRVRRFDSVLPVNGATGKIGAEVAVVYDPVNPTVAREAGRPLSKAFHNIVWYVIIVGLFALSIWLDGVAVY